MFISVLICTRNRASSLRRTLESLLCPNNLESLDWEVVVVDNDSDDQTSEVCRTFEKDFLGTFDSWVRKSGVTATH